MTLSRSSSRTPRVVFVTAGDPRRVTGGNIYDAHVVDALRRAEVNVRVVRADREAIPPADVVIVDSIAFARARVSRGRVVALAHMPTRSRRVLRRADRVVAVSHALAASIGRPDAVVIEPGADGVRRVRRRGRDEGVMRVLCVANASRVKGLDVLAAAARLVRDVRVDLVGDARDLPADAPIMRRGPLTGAPLARAYADADVVVVPSRSEGYGIAASEAIALGKPVIASDLPSLRAIVGDAGIFTAPSDVRALAHAIERMKDGHLRARLASRARRRARTLPRWADTERAFVSLVEEEMQRSADGGDRMPPRGVKSKKRTRQYEHIKQSEKKRGRSTKVAERIAAATTNKTRRKKGETKSSRKRS